MKRTFIDTHFTSIKPDNQLEAHMYMVKHFLNFLWMDLHNVFVTDVIFQEIIVGFDGYLFVTIMYNPLRCIHCILTVSILQDYTTTP